MVPANKRLTVLKKWSDLQLNVTRRHTQITRERRKNERLKERNYEQKTEREKRENIDKER